MAFTKLCLLVAVSLVLGAALLEASALNHGRMLSAQSAQLDERIKGPRVADSLQFIVVVSRHGNRPLKDYPTDPYPSNSTWFWPYGADEITTTGRRQLYALGWKIRSLYNGFLQRLYYPQETHASSINLAKTLMSGEAFLAGLYPPHAFQIWEQDIQWQPTALSSDSLDKTAVINSCPKYVEETEKVAMKFIEEYEAEISGMVSYYNWATGANVTGVQAVEALYHLGDKLYTEDLEGFDLPYWTGLLYPDRLMDFVAKVYMNLYAGTLETTRLMIGSFLGEVMDAMQAKVNGTLAERKLHYYSGHDSSIVALQVALGIPRESVIGLVRPGAALVLELHQDQNTAQYYVEAIIVDGYSTHATYLDIPMCGVPCAFDSFLGNTQNYTNVDYDEECKI